MAEKQIILMAGGSGLIGQKLQERFLAQGHEVRLLGRGYRGKEHENKFYWDPAEGVMDEAALGGVTWLINLAGEAVAGKKWTETRRRTIIDSRVISTRLLWQAMARTGYVPQKVVAASAVGYYGTVTTDHIFTETDGPGEGFLSEVCVKWETETDCFRTELHVPTVTLRIGVVLSAEGGALQEIAKPTRRFMGTVPGSGKQWVPWIHIDDLADIIQHTLENPEVQGVYNAVAPVYTNFEEWVHAAAKSLGKRVAPVHIPGVAVALAMGEQAEIVLEGSRVSAEKIMDTGFSFRFTDIQFACDDLLKR